nr:immunoglobulin heavy chain junction region [Mus musculus]
CAREGYGNHFDYW